MADFKSVKYCIFGDNRRTFSLRTNSKVNSDNRINWIDSLRGIGIILVLIGHTDTPFLKIIYGFHMPLFFLLSGYLYSANETWKMKFFKGIKRYIIPYFVLCFLNLIIQMLFQFLSISKGSSLKKYIFGIIYSRGMVVWMPNCSPLWFLTCIFVATNIFYIVNKLKSKINQCLCVIGYVCIALFLFSIEPYLPFNLGKLPWNISTAFLSVVFLWIGSILRKINIKEITNKMIIIYGILSFAFGLLAILLNPIKNVSFDNNKYGNFFLMFTGAILCSVGLGCLVMACKWVRESRLLKYFGKNTVIIMGFDYFSGTIGKLILEKFGILNWVSLSIFKILLIWFVIFAWNKILELVHKKLYSAKF